MKSFVVAFLILCCTTVYAQSPVSQGSVNLNGSLSYSSQSYDNGNPTLKTLSINPQASYFIIDNLSLGLSVNYERISIGASSTNYGIGPSLRYYFDCGKLYPFLSAGYSFTKSFNSINDDVTKGNQYILQAGACYFITKSVALEASVSYKREHKTLPDSYSAYYRDLEPKSNIILFGVGINFFLF